MAKLCSMKHAMAIVTLMCAVIFVAEVQACSLNDLAPCLNAVTKGGKPTDACCKRMEVVDVPCLCNLLAGGSYSPEVVKNAVTMPKNCGKAAYAHFQGQTCAGHTIT